jgi:hypothetical protein
MLFHSLTRFSLLAFLVAGSSACSKDVPSPTGSFQANFTSLRSNYAVGFPSGKIGFQVYTESAYANFRNASPLRNGQTPIVLSSDGTRYESTTVVDDLNPGNYVFVLGSAFTTSVQVTAGRTNSFDYSY